MTPSFVDVSYSPPAHCEESQPKTQATVTQEELTQEERSCSSENFTAAEVDGSEHFESVLPIIKTPSPDVYGHYPPAEPEPLGQKKTGLQRYSTDRYCRLVMNILRRMLYRA